MKMICEQILLNIAILFSCSSLKYVTGNSLFCPDIYEHARSSCDVNEEVLCKNAGCCWDGSTNNVDVRCYRKECKPGYFGDGCRYNCQCANNAACDKYTGICENGCAGQKWGIGCLLEQECTYNDQFGQKYLGKKSTTENDQTCVAWTIQRAYPDDQFPEKNKTKASNFCRNPQPSDYSTWCYYQYGQNPADRKWHYCSLNPCECPLGRWDINCVRECHCKNPDEKCDQNTGKCTSGCAERWSGDNCQDCADGLFGQLCDKQCQCSDSKEACDKNTGKCISGCAAGWTGGNCQTECSELSFGQNCEFMCNCADTREVCDKLTGHCDSGCKDGFTGAGCLIELPSIKRPVDVVSRTSKSIAVKWKKWENPPDTGDGPVNEYILRYKIKQGQGTSWQEQRTSGLQYNITSLDVNTSYITQVLPLRDNISGLPSPEVEITTCGTPLSMVSSLQLKYTANEPRAPTLSHTSESNPEGDYLVASWRLPDIYTWGCDKIIRYKVYKLELDGTFSLYGDIEKTARVSISGVNQYTNYTIGVSYVNSAGFESRKAQQSFAGKSGPVDNLQLTSTAHEIHLSWMPPKAPNGPIQTYLLRYGQHTVADCPTKRRNWKPIMDLPTNFTSFVIRDLDPYSQYEVMLWARTPAGKGQQVKRNVTTAPIMPSGKVEELSLENVTTTTATFLWSSTKCENRNGMFEGYKVELYNIVEPQVIRQSHLVNETKITLNNLIPYESYILKVSYVNNVGKGPAESFGVRTLEGIPPPPEKLWMKLTLSDQLVVAWEQPDPPHGLITKYELKYWSAGTGATPTILEFHPDENEFSLTRLHPNVSYRFQVRAYTLKGKGEWSIVAHGFTEESNPSEPQSLVNVSRGTHEIALAWKPPIKPNGILINYRVGCEVKRALGRYIESNQNQGETSEVVQSNVHEYVVRELTPGTEYTCKVEASTKKGFGRPIEKTFFTLPQEPEAPSFPTIEETKSTDTTITLSLPPTEYYILNIENSVVVHRIVVQASEMYKFRKKKRSVFKPTPCNQKHSALTDYFTAKKQNNPCYITAELPRQDRRKIFVVGDNTTRNGYYNAPLEKGHSYDIWFGVAVTVDGITHATYTKKDVVAQNYAASQSSATKFPVVAGTVAGIVLVVIILTLVLVIFITRRRKQPCKNPEMATRTESEHLTSSPRASSHHEKSSTAEPAHLTTDSEGEPDELDPLTGDKAGTIRRAIPVEHLWNYVRDRKTSKSNGFKQEYEEIPQNLRAQCEHARKPENRNSNRYGNIIAYDHSRVILEDIADLNSDYINANYIDAYRRPGAWIATQGPSKTTFNDFWHMVWQENSYRIIMVTNLIEDGRHKCDQYWPETGSKVFGKITIEKLEEEQYADFTIRTFNMTKQNEDLRIVRQFHFTAWPDHGCPTYATSLIAFRKKVRSYDDPTVGPTIVHCSAGVGRTGTFIALDYLLDQAKNENIVDVYNTVHLMRSKRVNMVQTQEQYEFVYEALLEALKSGDTAIACDDFRKCYLDLLQKNPDTGKQRIAEEYELLSIMTPPVSSTGCKDAVDPENVPKNRNQDIIPLDNLARPYLMTYIPGSSDYINAVFSDGYKHRDAFIITQMPLPQTIVDFWAMCYDHECSAIVMLNELDSSDNTCACYYPVQAGNQTHGPFTIETVALDTNYPDITVRDVTLLYNKKGSEPRSVRQFQYHGWSNDQALPLRRSPLIQLLQLIEKWQQRSGNKTIVVHCIDGATRSGLLCAISYMIERLKVEQEVDVFSSVKHSRINRPQLIPDLEQYKFIYGMAEEYMDCFGTYANFK